MQEHMNTSYIFILQLNSQSFENSTGSWRGKTNFL